MKQLVIKYFKANQLDLVAPFVTPKKNCCSRRMTGGLCLGLDFICCLASPDLNDCVDFEPAKIQQIKNNSESS